MRSYKTYEEILSQELKNPAFKKEYEALKPKYEAISAVIKARLESGMTQAELARKIKTKQANISRFESGNVTPSIPFLQKIAQAFGKKLEIRFKSTV